MLIVGLTGSIGMGKSAAAARFRDRGIAVFDADAEVHTLYSGPLSARDRSRVSRNHVRRHRGPHCTFKSRCSRYPHRFKDLEALVHPRVRAAQRAFLQREAAKGARVAVLEIPLLFEGGADKLTDLTIVVSANSNVQRARVLARPGMTDD